MAGKHIGLGRGLDALIKDGTTAKKQATAKKAASREAAGDAGGGVREVSVNKVVASPWQPRSNFGAEALSELVDSVKVHGVLQPLLVREVGTKFELIAGERRLRAAQAALLKKIPIIVVEASDEKALAVSFESSRTVHPIAEELLSVGHAKVLLSVDSHREMELLAKRSIKEGLSVRALEKIVKKLGRPPRKPRAERADLPSDYLHTLSDGLHQYFGTSVRINPSKTLTNGRKVKGSLEVDFHDNDELDRLLGLVGYSSEL